MRRLITSAFSLVAGSAIALADDPPATPPPEPPSAAAPADDETSTTAPTEITLPEPPPSADSAAAVRGAPRPGDESGRVDAPQEESVLRQVGRGALFIPRAAFEIALSPVRGGLWAYDRYQIGERWMQWFFNDARTIGVYPTLFLDSGFGFTAGGRFVWRDIFGEQEHFSLRASTGGQYWTAIRGSARTGNRLGRVELELRGEYEERPKDRFFGIGNSDETTTIPAMTIDPLTDPTAIDTRYRQRMMRTSLAIDTRLVSDLHVRAAGALTDVEFGSSDYGNASIEEAYMTDQLVGFEGVRHAYGELELVWDSRGRYTRWEPSSLDAIGWLASIYAGREAVEDLPDFWRVGGDAQYFLRFGTGPRVLAARARVESVSGSIDEVPFDELPKLGGTKYLRGYETDRFRDRAAALGTIEYRWDLAWFLIANLFVDAGKVAPSVSDLDTGDLRVGYGIGLEAYTERYFVARVNLASSVDGGVFLNLSFDPAFDLDPRVERR
jgi:hypothetical protein